MHAISSYRGNRPTNKQTNTNTQTDTQTHRQDQLQYTAPQLASAQCKHAQDNSKICRRILAKFVLEGWNVRLSTTGYIFGVIRIVMRIQQEFLKEFLPLRGQC